MLASTQPRHTPHDQEPFVAEATVSAFTRHVPFSVSIDNERKSFEFWKSNQLTPGKLWLWIWGPLTSLLLAAMIVASLVRGATNDLPGALLAVGFLVAMLGTLTYLMFKGWYDRKCNAEWMGRHQTILRHIMEVFLKRAAEILPESKTAVLAGGELIAFSSRGFIVGDIELDELKAVPATVVSEVQIAERTRQAAAPKPGDAPLNAAITGAVLGSLLFDNANVGATIGAAHGVGKSVESLRLTHTWIVDVYTSDERIPLVTLDFAGEESTAKLCRATVGQCLKR